MIVGTADQHARSSFSASALFSERLRGTAHSVKKYIIAPLEFFFSVNTFFFIMLSEIIWLSEVGARFFIGLRGGGGGTKEV